jgi:hypothetical protein
VVSVTNPYGRNLSLLDQFSDISERIKVNLNFEKEDGVVGTGLIWLRIGISGGLLWTW